MAITRQYYFAAASNNPTVGNFPIGTEDIDWIPGDVVVCWWYTRTNTKTFTDVSGKLTEKATENSTVAGRLWIGYRVLVTGDSAFQWSSSSVSNATTVHGSCVFRGVEPTSPFDASSDITIQVNVVDPDPPPVNIVTNDSCAICLFGKNNDYTGITPPVGYELAGAASSTAGSDASGAFAYRLNRSAGVEDPYIFDLTGGLVGDDGYTWTAALKPVGAGGWKSLQYASEPPSAGFNQLKYAVEPPVSSAWNKVLFQGE